MASGGSVYVQECLGDGLVRRIIGVLNARDSSYVGGLGTKIYGHYQ